MHYYIKNTLAQKAHSWCLLFHICCTCFVILHNLI